MEKENNDITIENIVSDIFTTFSIKKRKKDIVKFYLSKYCPDVELFSGKGVTEEHDIESSIERILKDDQNKKQDSFLRLNKGIYTKRPNKNPGGVNNPTETLYKGKAGECAVMSELLFHGYNVNSMMVDEGVDLVASKDNIYYYIQVKTTSVNEKNRVYFTIKSDRYNVFVGKQMRYILVARCSINKKDTNLYFVFDNKVIDQFVFSNCISKSDDRINIKIEFDDRTGKAYVYDKSKQDISYFLNNFAL